ncbi:MAG: GAF domain-containing protein [Myxococcota bacterium]
MLLGDSLACPAHPTRAHLIHTVLQTRQPTVMGSVTREYLASRAQSPEHLELLLAADIHSLMAVPLTRGRFLGVMLLASSQPSRRYGPEDLRLAEELASRAAHALEYARLYRAAHEAITARDNVLAIVSHDLKTPLCAIQRSTHLLMRNDAHGKDLASLKHVRAI